MSCSVSRPVSCPSYLYQPFGLGLIQVHRGMIQGVIQNKTCNNIYIYLSHIYNKSCPIHATEHMCDKKICCIYEINNVLHVLFCITPCIMPLVPVSARLRRTIILYYIILLLLLLCYIILYYIILYYIILCYIILYCITLHYIALHCIT